MQSSSAEFEDGERPKSVAKGEPSLHAKAPCTRKRTQTAEKRDAIHTNRFIIRRVNFIDMKEESDIDTS